MEILLKISHPIALKTFTVPIRHLILHLSIQNQFWLFGHLILLFLRYSLGLGTRLVACCLQSNVTLSSPLSKPLAGRWSWHPVHHQGPWRRYGKGGQLWFGSNSGVIPAFPPQWLKKIQTGISFLQSKGAVPCRWCPSITSTWKSVNADLLWCSVMPGFHNIHYEIWNWIFYGK